MDPELYIFPKINNPLLKIAASTALFALVISAARLLSGRGPWVVVFEYPAGWLTLLYGYGLFIFASLKAWQAAREKNTVEDPQRQTPTRLLDTGAYARVRHPMYGMFILANAGLGLAANSVYGLCFSLLSLLIYVLNGIFEEKVALFPLFGEGYREYMRRVPVRYLTFGQALLLVTTLLVYIVGVFMP